MISPAPGVVFTESSDGDLLVGADRRSVASRLAIPETWATVRQVHGSEVRIAETGGSHGDADALISRRPDVPIAVFTADCVGVVIRGIDHVAVVHAGWRGLVGGVIEAVQDGLEKMGDTPRRAWIGPAIGPCCFEVGADVSTQFPDSLRVETSWGTPSVDLWQAAAQRIDADEVWVAGTCTRHEDGWWSHRADGTRSRLATVAWIENEP